MGVPKYIREVPRPTNTVVIDNGKDGPTRYAVRERSGVQYISGGNPQPKNGKVVGHIVDGVWLMHPMFLKQGTSTGSTL